MAGYNNLLIAAIDGDERFEVKVLLLMLHLKKKNLFPDGRPRLSPACCCCAAADE